MLRRSRANILLAALLTAWFGTAPARASTPTQSSPTRVDPAISSAFSYLAAHGVVQPWYDARPNSARPAGMLPVLVRGANADAATVSIRTLPKSQVQWLHGGVPLASGALSVLVTRAGFDALAADRRITRLSIDLPRVRQRPLAQSRIEAGTNVAVRAMLAKNGKLLDGTGVTIADVDSGIYVHHPALFRADAGAHAWIDLDDDGVFTAGTDAVDVGGDAMVVRRLPAFGASFYPPYKEVLPVGDTFRPELDHLYIDVNGNGERDYGKGFDESTPAYGEPLFVADDANGNGRLDRDERLLQLGSSKLRKIHTDRDRTRGSSTRGIGGWLAKREDAPSTSHGTGVAGILVGGVWGRSQLLGLAPNADLLSYDYATRPPRSQTEAVQWAIDERADVILTEYAPYTSHPLDGSSEEELLLDSAVAGGAIAVSPAGNLTGGGKHQSVRLGALPVEVALRTDKYFDGSDLVILTLLEHGPEHALDIELTLPGRGSVVLADASTSEFSLGGGFYADVQKSRTSAGTTMRNVYVYGPSKMPMGSYTLTLTAPTAPAGGTPLELYVSDAFTSWAGGLTFNAATDAKTVCHPATAQRTLAVAAYTLHDEPGYSNSSALGDMASYSSSGPLLDGRIGIALAAPDNPLSLGVPEYGKPGGIATSYAPFGGTSGAGPHVAAAAALLRQAFPTESADQLRTRLTASARPMNGPPERWGSGKLDVAAALGIAVGNSAAPRDARIETPADGLVLGRDNKVHVAVVDDGATFHTRWDLDYDGTPDTDWIDGLETTLVAQQAGPRAIRVDVADADGNVTGATLLTEILTEPLVIITDGGTQPQQALVASELGGGGCTSAPRESRYASGLLLLIALIGARRSTSRRSDRQPPSRASRRARSAR